MSRRLLGVCLPLLAIVACAIFIEQCYHERNPLARLDQEFEINGVHLHPRTGKQLVLEKLGRPLFRDGDIKSQGPHVEYWHYREATIGFWGGPTMHLTGIGGTILCQSGRQLLKVGDSRTIFLAIFGNRTVGTGEDVCVSTFWSGPSFVPFVQNRIPATLTIRFDANNCIKRFFLIEDRRKDGRDPYSVSDLTPEKLSPRDGERPTNGE